MNVLARVIPCVTNKCPFPRHLPLKLSYGINELCFLGDQNSPPQYHLHNVFSRPSSDSNYHIDLSFVPWENGFKLEDLVNKCAKPRLPQGHQWRPFQDYFQTKLSYWLKAVSSETSTMNVQNQGFPSVRDKCHLQDHVLSKPIIWT